LSIQISGSITMITFTILINVKNGIMDINSSLDKTVPLLSFSLKYLIQSKEKIIMIIIAIVTNNK
jgi:hypothetical protein